MDEFNRHPGRPPFFSLESEFQISVSDLLVVRAVVLLACDPAPGSGLPGAEHSCERTRS
jgi:hypothetical protein